MAGARLERPHNELREVEHAEVTRARPRWLLERRLPNHDFRLEEGLEERPILRVDVRLADRAGGRVDTTEVSVAPHRSFGSYDRDFGGNPGHMTGISGGNPGGRPGFRAETPVVDPGFGRDQAGFPVGRGRNHGGAHRAFDAPEPKPRRAGAAKPGRPERAFGAKVRCAGPKLRRRTTIGP